MWQGSNYNENLTVQEIAKLIRKQLKEDFPNAKWSITTDRRSISIALVEYDKVISNVFDEGYFSINHFAIERNTNLSNEGKILFIRARDLAQSYNYTDSEVMRDYHNCRFHVDISLGRWDRPFKVVKNKNIE